MIIQKLPFYKKVYHCAFCYSLFSLFISSVSSQVQKDTLVAHGYITKADSLYNSKDYKKALAVYQEAKTEYAKAEAWERAAECMIWVARSHSKLNDFDMLYNSLQKSLAFINEKIKGPVEAEGETYYLLSRYYELGKSDFASAIDYLEKAKKTFETLPDAKDGLAVSYNRLGRVYLRMGDYKKALKAYEQGSKLSIEVFGEVHHIVAGLYNNRGILYNRLGETDEAIASFEKATELREKLVGENDSRLFPSYINLSDTYRNFSNLKKAEEYNGKALKIVKNGKDVNYSYLSMVYASRALIFSKMQQDEKSIEFAKIAMSNMQKINGKSPLEESVIIRVMANSLSNIGEHDRAIELVQRELDLNIKAFGEKHNKVGEMFVDLGRFYRTKGTINKALINHKKAVEIFKAIHGDKHEQVPYLYKELALDYAQLQNDSLQLIYLIKAQENRNKIHKKGHVRRIGGLIDLSNAYLDSGQLSASRNYLDQVFEEKGKLGAIAEEDIGYSEAITWLDIFALEANWHRKNYDFTKRRDDLEKSILCFMKIDSLVDKLAANYDYQKDRVSFYERTQKVYQQAIEAHLTYSTYEANAKEMVFYFIEKSKANNLRSLIKSEDVQKFSDVPEHVVKQDQELRTKRAYYLSKLAKLNEGENNTEYLKNYEEKLFEVNSKYDSLLKVMQTSYPHYSRLKHSSKVITLEKTKKELQSDAVILQYMYTPRKGYLFLISDNSVDVITFDTETLETDIEALVEAVTNKDLKVYKEKAFTLYNTLLEPIAKKLGDKELIIIPYGQMWKLNFDLLLTNETATNNPKEFPYLIKQNPISYANSATLRFGVPQQEGKVLQECLAFSFTSQDSTLSGKEITLSRLRDSGVDLPGTRQEIKEIAELLDGSYYYGEEAKEANFKAHANNYAILHLALHGEVDDKNPGDSRLFFTQTKDSIEDSYLYTHELYALSLPAELAVLSACNTGTGKVTFGEGIMSLGNAFQYAGTQSLLLSHWEVSDVSTPELMKYFYTNLKKGMTKAKALQQAKLSYLESAATNRVHPFYWGSFYLLGDGAPIALTTPNKLWYLIIGGLIVCLVFWYAYVRFNKKIQ